MLAVDKTENTKHIFDKCMVDKEYFAVLNIVTLETSEQLHGHISVATLSEQVSSLFLLKISVDLKVAKSKMHPKSTKN